MDNRQHSTLAGAGSGEVVERLLPNSERKTHRVGDGNFSPAVADVAVYRACIGDEKLALHVVVCVIAHASRQHERTLNAPPRCRPEIETAAGEERLSDCKLSVLYSPRA